MLPAAHRTAAQGSKILEPPTAISSIVHAGLAARRHDDRRRPDRDHHAGGGFMLNDQHRPSDVACRHGWHKLSTVADRYGKRWALYLQPELGHATDGRLNVAIGPV